jgi:hypothetical protein
MDFQKPICVVGLLLVLSVTFGSAGDIVHPDDVAPKRPGCDNNFVLVRYFLKPPNLYFFIYWITVWLLRKRRESCEQ